MLAAVDGSDRGLKTTKQARQAIDKAVDELQKLGEGSVTTDSKLSAQWKLVWTTEKESLFILQTAPRFGTEAGDVYQVIDMQAQRLQNVITFPPEGAFVVDSSVRVAGAQRMDFQFKAATLQLPQGRRVQLPPFGKGWFDSVYMDAQYRVARDIRGDTLVCIRDGAPQLYN